MIFEIDNYSFLGSCQFIFFLFGNDLHSLFEIVDTLARL